MTDEAKLPISIRYGPVTMETQATIEQVSALVKSLVREYGEAPALKVTVGTPA